MLVNFKKLNPEAITPSYAKEGDAGLDITAISMEYDSLLKQYIYKTGLAFEIPPNHVGLLFPRSSVSKTGLMLSNSVGVIDSGFRGELTFKFNEIKGTYNNYEVGNRIGQLLIIPYPQITLNEVEQLSDTERGSGSYGSSGR